MKSPGAAPKIPGPNRPRWSRAVGRFFAYVVWNTRTVGAELVPPDGAVIIASNHLALVDGPLVHGVAPRITHMLVKEELYRWPLSWLLLAAGQIPVDRRNGRPALAAALAVLRRGGAIGIFPEGNRGRGDASTARAGTAWLAVYSGAPVVPVAVLGTRRTGESVNGLPGLRRRLHVEFGEPVALDLKGLTGRDAVGRAHELLRVALQAHVLAVAERAGFALPADRPEPDSGELPGGPVRP